MTMFMFFNCGRWVRYIETGRRAPRFFWGEIVFNQRDLTYVPID